MAYTQYNKSCPDPERIGFFNTDELAASFPASAQRQLRLCHFQAFWSSKKRSGAEEMVSCNDAKVCVLIFFLPEISITIPFNI